MRVLARREVRPVAVSDAVRARHEMLRVKVQFALRDAFDRFAASVLEDRATGAHIEDDLIRIEDGILRAVHEVGVAANRDRMVAVVMRAVADDLPLDVEDVDVADEIGGTRTIARALDLVGDRDDLVRLQRRSGRRVRGRRTRGRRGPPRAADQRNRARRTARPHEENRLIRIGRRRSRRQRHGARRRASRRFVRRRDIFDRRHRGDARHGQQRRRRRRARRRRERCGLIAAETLLAVSGVGVGSAR